MSSFREGDIIIVQNFSVDEDEPDPNGFIGLIKNREFIFEDEQNPLFCNEWIYDVELPISWHPDRPMHEWTLRQNELRLANET